MNLLKQRIAAVRLLTICVLLSGMHPAFSQTDPQAGQPKFANVTQCPVLKWQYIKSPIMLGENDYV